MALSRLENFLKNYEGNLIYVNPTDFDATDSYDNQGNSLTRPFKTIQRALIEAARFSYQVGSNNDKIDKTTILVYPGTHYIDNRPGYSIQNINNAAVIKAKTGPTTWTSSSLPELDQNTNFDILDTNNDLYKFNSVYGGAILPRGTSIIGLDLRKTKIRPLYVPNPNDNTIDNSSIFNVTGTCYFTAFTFFDADTGTAVFKDYTTNRYIPEFSHHKLVAFAYADGVNKVKLGYEQTNLTDLDMYYYKISEFYGQVTGRPLTKYPSGLDFESSPGEFTIVGNIQTNPLGISSIYSGNGITPTNIITVSTKDFLTGEPKEHGFQVDSPILISGITVDPSSYNGSFTVKEVIGLTTFTYTSSSTPSNPVPINVDPGALDVASVILESDTVNSASPYVFNCSLRSVYGLCGLWADGNKSDGFKSMVVAQFTGISLQKDNDAFLLYQNGTYYDNVTLPQGSIERPLHTNSNSIYKPDYQNFHIRCSNGSFVQCVSVFAIGYARHFYAESGGDMSITNSNSNFGSVSLESTGFRNQSFDRDDVGYITHIIPPKETAPSNTTISWLPLDGDKIRTSGVSTNKLYLYGYDDLNEPPLSQLGGYRVGSKNDDKLYLIVTSGLGQTTYSSPILMPVPSGTGVSARKTYTLGRSVGINSISSNILTLTTNHQLFNGEQLRIYSDTGQAPFGLSVGTLYYAITTGLNANQIKLALSYNDALSGNYVSGITNNGGIISIISSVSDKFPNDPGHPVQFDSTANQWYVNGSLDVSNQIRSVIVGGGITTKTNDTYIIRKSDDRLIDDRIYKVRYVIPKEYQYARIPRQGFVLEESKTVGVSSISYSSADINDSTDIRNEKVIANATAGSIVNNKQVVTIKTELPHNFIVGDKANIQKIASTNNPTGIGITSTYNGSYYVESIPTLRTFTYTISGVSTNPGAFANNINLRNTSQQRNSLPLVSREEYSNSYKIYKVDIVRNHIPGSNGQDGIYYLTLLSSNAKTSDSVGYGISTLKFSQDVRNLYPQIDRDNFNSDPYPTISYADEQKIAKVITDDKTKSITKESLNLFTKNSRIGFGITAISVSGVGNTTVTIYTDVEHQLNSIKSISFVNSGSGFPISTSVYSASLTDALSQECATASFNTTAGGSIDTNTFSLLYSGSSCGIGSTYIISGGTTNALVQVSDINNNVGDGLELNGFNDSQLKGIFKVQSIVNKKELKIYAPSGVNNYLPNTNGYVPSAYIASKGIGITSFRFTNVSSGIVTVTTATPHGLLIGNKISIIESGTSIYNNDFVVANVVGLNTFTTNVGIATTNPSSTKGTLFKRGFASASSVYGTGQEGRATYIYAGISTTTTSLIDTNSTSIQLSSSGGFRRGDYISVGNEIIRLASVPSGNAFNILRSQFGSYRETNIPSGSLIKKIRVLPVEFRRPSFVRASGHTFEYLGYGPGNYSNSLPQKQVRTLDSDDVVNSQARKSNSGLVVYNGINDLGENYNTGAKKTLYTGQDIIVEAPIVTYLGDDASQQIGTLVNSDFDDLLVRRALTVEGGENGILSSQFYGPVNFTRKLTNNSTDGVEIRNLYLSGINVAQPKLITVDNSKPSTTPVIGAISLLNNPSSSDGYVGNIYITNPATNNNEWRRFGLISKTVDKLNFKVDKLGIGVDNSSDASYDFVVANNTKLNNLTVVGTLSLQQVQQFQDVRFVNTEISGIATVRNRLDVVGFTTTKNLYVSGISTFANSVNVNANLQVVGNTTLRGDQTFTVTPATTADTYTNFNSTNYYNFLNFQRNGTTFGTLQASYTGSALNYTFDHHYFRDSTTGKIRVLINSSGNVAIGTDNVSSRLLVNGTIGINGLNDTSSTGRTQLSSSSSGFVLNHNDTSPIIVQFQGTEQLRIGAGGTFTYSLNNSGADTAGTNFVIKQSGSGDAVLTWRNDYLNANQKWYAGIDRADSYKWKLAHPSVVTADGSESFAADTKLSIDINGNASLVGIFTCASFGSLNNNLSFNGSISVAQNSTIGQNVSVGGTITVTGGSGGPAITLRSGGDLVFYNSSNAGVATIFCDTDNQLNTNNNIFAKSYIKSNSSAVNLSVLGGGYNLGYTKTSLNAGIGTYNFLRSDGSDSPLTTSDFLNYFGFIPQPPVTINSLPSGNSLVLDDFSAGFNGSTRIFNLSFSGNSFVPVGPYNLIVVVNGSVKKASADYIILQSVGNYTNQIQFTVAPTSGSSCFIIALGGQGSLTQNQDWNAAGDIIAGISDNNATIVPIGSNGQIFTVDTSLSPKLKWSSNIDISGNLKVGIATASSLNVGSGAITSGNVTSSGTITATSLNVGSGAITSGNVTSSGIITATSFVGNGTIPIGGIIMWSGTIAAANALTNWKLCDGTNGTPNLTDKFIVCATSGSGNGTVSTAGPGFSTITGALSASYTPGNTGGETAHRLTTTEMPPHTHNLSGSFSVWFSNPGTNNNYVYRTGGSTATTSTGGNAYQENRPAYYALAFIMRVA